MSKDAIRVRYVIGGTVGARLLHDLGEMCRPLSDSLLQMTAEKIELSANLTAEGDDPALDAIEAMLDKAGYNYVRWVYDPALEQNTVYYHITTHGYEREYEWSPLLALPLVDLRRMNEQLATLDIKAFIREFQLPPALPPLKVLT